MTTQARGMTGDADESLAEPGVPLAGGGSGATEAKPLSDNVSDEARGRNREQAANVLATLARPAQTHSDVDRMSLKRAEAAMRAVNAIIGGSRVRVPGVAEDAPKHALVIENGRADQPPVPLDATVIDARQLLAQMPQKEIFDLIKEARAVVDVPEPSAASQADYTKKVDRLRTAGSETQARPDAGHWQQALYKYAGRRESFKAYRAAICWHLRRELREQLKAQDRLQREGNRGEVWRDAVAEVKRLLDVYISVNATTRHDAPEADGLHALPGLSKKHALTKIARKYPAWRSIILEACAGSPYEDAIRLMSLVGCRPEEVARGISVSMDATGRAWALIKGAKVTDKAGQAWRNIPFDLSKMRNACGVALEMEGKYLIQVKSKDGLRNYLQRLSKKTLPKVPAVTAYVFRHALAGELRDGGASAEEIAAVLGHRVSDTQKAYGPRGRGSRGKRSPAATALDVKAVAVAKPVRPLDRSGLSTVAGRKPQRKSKPKLKPG